MTVPADSAFRVSLLLEPDPGWLPLLEDAVRRFADRLDFPGPLTDLLVAATLEACDNLALCARQHGIADTCRLDLGAGAEAVTVDLVYNGRIPLNPLAAEDYEVPDAASDPEAINADALWLHLIKRRMDKVFFRVEGSRHVLSLVLYRRPQGREGELWVMPLCPDLSPEARLERFRGDGDGQAGCGLLYLPRTGAALRLGPGERFFVERFDGRRSVYDLYLEYIDTVGLISPASLASLYESLERHGLLRRDAPAGGRRHWSARLRRLFSSTLSIPHADGVLEAAYHRLRLLVTPLGAMALVLVGLSGLYPLLRRPELLGRVAGLEAFFRASPLSLVALYAMMFVMLACHELAHGLVCKHFGGRVHRLGIMFYLTMFIFYCDTTSAYTFPRKSQRILVSLAGPLVTFAFLGLGLWLAWGQAGAGTSREYCWVAFCFLCFFTLAMSLNPLLKMDGYFMLMDWLGVPNLRERSFRFLKHRLFGRFLPVAGRQAPEEPDPRLRRIFWWYGTLGALFTLAFVIWPVVLYAGILARRSADQGRLLWAALVLTLILSRLTRQAYATLHAWRHREYRIQ